MDALMRQIRHAMRSLSRTPSFAVSAVLLLGLGVGSVTTIFTVVDHVLLRPLPYPAADRLFEVQNGSHTGLDLDAFEQFRTVEMWAAATVNDVNLTGIERPQRLREAMISRDYFALLGARPVIGRLFVEDDFRTGEGVVLSAGVWQRLFGADADVLGRTIVLNGTPRVVVGVMSERFRPPDVMESAVDLYRPIDRRDEWYGNRSYHMLSVIGRVMPPSPARPAPWERRPGAGRAAYGCRRATAPRHPRRLRSDRRHPGVIDPATIGR